MIFWDLQHSVHFPGISRSFIFFPISCSRIRSKMIARRGKLKLLMGRYEHLRFCDSCCPGHGKYELAMFSHYLRWGFMIVWFLCFWSSGPWCRTLEWLLTMKILISHEFWRICVIFANSCDFLAFFMRDSFWEQKAVGKLKKMPQLSCSQLLSGLSWNIRNFSEFCKFTENLELILDFC